MIFKNNQVLLLVVAFLVGFFFHKILKGCNIVEGARDNGNASGVDGGDAGITVVNESWNSCHMDSANCCKNYYKDKLKRRNDSLDEFKKNYKNHIDLWSNNQAGTQLSDCTLNHRDMNLSKKCIKECNGEYKKDSWHCTATGKGEQALGKRINPGEPGECPTNDKVGKVGKPDDV